MVVRPYRTIVRCEFARIRYVGRNYQTLCHNYQTLCHICHRRQRRSKQRDGIGVSLVGAVEHLKTLCCLGLPPESAMVAVTPLLHEIIPHGWSRIVLLEPDGTFGHGYAENPETAAIFRERMWRFNDDPSSPAFLWTPSFHAVAIGWTLHMQGRGWLESGWYREIEAPLDSCWILDAMIGDAGQTFALAHLMLTRPRSARPFTVDDVSRPASSLARACASSTSLR